MNKMFVLLRVAMGAFFLYTSFAKLGSMDETGQFITRSDIFPEYVSMPLAFVGIAMEMIVGFGLFFKWQYRGAVIWALIMCTSFIAFFINAWARGLSLSCNCFGSQDVIDNYPVELSYRLLLLGAILLLYWDVRRQRTQSWKRVELDLSELED